MPDVVGLDDEGVAGRVVGPEAEARAEKPEEDEEHEEGADREGHHRGHHVHAHAALGIARLEQALFPLSTARRSSPARHQGGLVKEVEEEEEQQTEAGMAIARDRAAPMEICLLIPPTGDN
jgi:hypothetical protein